MVCEDGNEPSKAVDCANEMIQENVAAVVVGQNGVAESSWRVLQTVGIPYFVYGVGSSDVLADASSTFNRTNSKAALIGLPAGVAKKNKAKKVTRVIIDVPAATDIYRGAGAAMFSTLGAFAAATKGLKGEVTPESVTQAIKTMDWTVVPGTRGLHFRCNGQADPTQPALCTSATNTARLGATGTPSKYAPVNDAPIPD